MQEEEEYEAVYVHSKCFLGCSCDSNCQLFFT